MSHRRLSGTSVGPHTIFLSHSQDPIAVGLRYLPVPIDVPKRGIQSRATLANHAIWTLAKPRYATPPQYPTVSERNHHATFWLAAMQAHVRYYARWGSSVLVWCALVVPLPCQPRLMASGGWCPRWTMSHSGHTLPLQIGSTPCAHSTAHRSPTGVQLTMS